MCQKVRFTQKPSQQPPPAGTSSGSAQKRDLQGVRDDQLLGVERRWRQVRESDGKHFPHIHQQLWRLMVAAAFQQRLGKAEEPSGEALGKRRRSRLRRTCTVRMKFRVTLSSRSLLGV